MYIVIIMHGWQKKSLLFCKHDKTLFASFVFMLLQHTEIWMQICYVTINWLDRSNTHSLSSYTSCNEVILSASLTTVTNEAWLYSVQPLFLSHLHLTCCIAFYSINVIGSFAMLHWIGILQSWGGQSAWSYNTCLFYYRPHCAQRKSSVFSLLSRPAGPTRCTDGGEIWHGGGTEGLLQAKFHPHRCNDKGAESQKLKFLLRFNQNVHIPCAIFTKFAEFVPHFRMH